MDITVAGAVSAWAPSSAGGVCIVREGTAVAVPTLQHLGFRVNVSGTCVPVGTC